MVSFDILGFFEMVDERLGNFIGDSFFALVVFAIIFFVISYIFRKVVLPIFSYVRGWQEFRKKGFWDPATMVFVILFVGVLVTFINAVSLKVEARKAFQNIEKIEEYRKQIEKHKKEVEKRRELAGELLKETQELYEKAKKDVIK